MAIDINVSPAEDTTTRTETRGGTVMAPAASQALRDEAKANEAAATATQAVGEAQTLEQAVKADQLAEASTLARRQAADQAAEYQFQKDKQDAVRAAAEAADEQFAGHKFHDFWSTKTVGQKIATAFGLFTAGTGSAYLGQENPVAKALYRAIDQDYEKQKTDLGNLRERAKMKHQDVNDLYTQQGHDNAALAIKFAKANEATAAEMVQRLAEAGVPLKDAEGNATVAGLRARAAEKRREAFQHYDSTYSNSLVTSQKLGDQTKGPTESQSKTSLTAEQMADSLKIIKENPPLSQGAMEKLKNNELAMSAADTSAGKDLMGNAGARIGRFVGAIPKSKYEGLTPQEQTVSNAWDNVKELYVRQFTGAGMPETEAQRAAEQYGPRPGDSPELVSQKFQRQERMVEQMRAQSPQGTTAMARAGVSMEGKTAPAAAPSSRLDRARAASRDPEATPKERRRAFQIIEEEVRNRRAAGAR